MLSSVPAVFAEHPDDVRRRKLPPRRAAAGLFGGGGGGWADAEPKIVELADDDGDDAGIEVDMEPEAPAPSARQPSRRRAQRRAPSPSALTMMDEDDVDEVASRRAPGGGGVRPDSGFGAPRFGEDARGQAASATPHLFANAGFAAAGFGTTPTAFGSPRAAVAPSRKAARPWPVSLEPSDRNAKRRRR